MVTGGLVQMDAQWALHGKNADGEDYRILSCSTGALNRANFDDALSRFQLGELSTLPQVSVSYARHGTQPGLSYLALAIHWHATEGQRHAHGVAHRDSQGRPTAYTSYFCLPYKRLADAAIGYLAMYEALRAVRLTVADGPPLRVTFTAPTARILAIDPLAMRVAALLLAGRPVCVLGAERTSMLERLGFIDTVMELLPYGFRSRMTAATWTRATNRTHRFRLFFSSAPRADEPDHVVNWGDDPDLVHPPGGDAGEYFDWLQDNLAPLARLADLTAEIGFGAKDTLQGLESALGARRRLRLRPGPAANIPSGPEVTQDPASREAVRDPASQEPPAAPAQADPGEEALLGCAEHAKLANPTRLRSDIAFLKKLAEGELGEDSRKRYQELITKLGLLRRGFPVNGRYQERLYDALLPMAFGTPLSYTAFCWTEKSAGLTPGEAPHEELLTAIASTGMTQTVSAIVYWHLGQTDEKKLNKWLISGHVDIVQLIDLLARNWRFPQHARIVCDVTLEFLKKAPRQYRPQEVRLALREHGFLAYALHLRHPGEEQYQVQALYQFLKAAYPGGLGRSAIVPVLANSAHPPSPALLAAIVKLVSKPEDVQLACDVYTYQSLTLMNVDSAVAGRLRDLAPDIARASSLAAVEDAPAPKLAEPPV